MAKVQRHYSFIIKGDEKELERHLEELTARVWLRCLRAQFPQPLESETTDIAQNIR